MTRAVLVGTAGIVWLVFPSTTITSASAVALPRAGPVAPAAAPRQDGTSGDDLVLPLIAVGAAGILAVYGYVRRTHRARTRTTPGGGDRDGADRHGADRHGEDGGDGGSRAGGPGRAPLTALEARACDALVLADDCVRTSREELGFAEVRSGTEACAPFVRAVRQAETEVAAAFRTRQRYDEGVPDPADDRARRRALADMTGRCEEAGRLLDAAVTQFDALRGLDREESLGEALVLAETRFRELAGRTTATEQIVTALHERYAPTACEPVTGYVEQAKDRLMFATAHLNQARQSADRGGHTRAAAELRAAEGAVVQVAVFLDAVSSLAEDLEEAASLVPAALSGAEAARAGAEERLTGVPAGEVQARILHAGAVLTSVRRELTSGRAYDPLGVLRRVVAATAPLGAVRAGVLSAAALLTARSAVAAAEGFITTHRGAVGATARARLVEAQRLLAAEDSAVLPRADALARTARDLAEQDVRTHGNPYAEADAHTPGTAGALRGGILLPGPSPTGAAPSYGGPGKRKRRAPHVS
ncbi:hypothetical protein [Streptomyces mexicanus]|uniref:hypothetical protein n=1 Tax=Streptomyces mexicanus TaxID=178566 RepID=UPI0031F17B9B